MKNENDKGTLQGHTAGPWHWSVNRLCGELGQCVAFAPDEAYESPDSSVRAANERLLCAAPELLQACQMLLVRLEDMPGLPKGGVYDFARAAIAKAKGGQS